MDIADLIIPQTPSSITSDWLTRALRCTGVLTDAKVVGIHVAPIAAGSGFVGQTARLRIDYDQQTVGAPATVFAKLSSANPTVRQQLRQVGLYATESGFYRDIAPLPDCPLTLPRPYLSLYNEETGECLLLLEDLGHAEFGDNLAGCSSADAQLVVEKLGSLHAHYWEAPILKQLPWLRSLGDEAAVRIGLYRSMLPRFEKRCSDILTPVMRESARRFAELLPRYIAQQTSRPQTFTHGDFRADNFAFTSWSGGRRLTVFDWQVSRCASGPRDLAYFLSGSLPVEQRRATERSLLSLYHETLVANGVSGYDAGDLMRDVQAGLGAPLTTWVIAGGMLDFSSQRGASLFGEVCARLSAMLEDHRFGAYLNELASSHTGTT